MDDWLNTSDVSAIELVRHAPPKKNYVTESDFIKLKSCRSYTPAKTNRTIHKQIEQAMLKAISTREPLTAAEYLLHRNATTSAANLRVVFLTNFIPPYRLPVLRALGSQLGALKTFVSTEMEANRSWASDWQGLHVDIQRSLSFRKMQRHPNGFDQDTYVHLPYDTIPKLAKFSPDVVISGEMGARTAQAVLYRLATPKSRLIIYADLSEHTELGCSRARTHLRRWMLRYADAVLVNGESGKRYVRSLGVPDSRLFCVPYATDISVYGRQCLERDLTTVTNLLHVGQLIERKGIVKFIHTLSNWSEKHPNRLLELILVGDGPLRSSIETLNSPLNLRIKLISHVPYSEMPSIYSQADLLVLPSLADSWGLVINEAMAAGLPVLGSVKSQAVEELVNDGENGWVFNPDNPSETYLALDRALSAPKETLARMREKARETAFSVTPNLAAERMLGAIDFCMNPLRHAISR